MTQKLDEVDVSRRDLGTLLGLLGGAAGLAALSSCTAQGAERPESTSTIGEALNGTTNINWVDTVANLRLLPGGANYVAILESYAVVSPPDGGGGLFVWSTVVAVDDGGTILNCGGLGSNQAGWRRVFTGAYNVKWFGAKGNGTGDDAPAIKAAIAAATGFGAPLGDGGTNPTAVKSGSIFVPIGMYSIQSTLTYAGPGGFTFTIRGEAGSANGGGYSTTLLWNGPTGGTMMELRAFQDSLMEDLDFDGNWNGTTGAAICVWYHSNQSYGYQGSSGCVFRKCSFLAVGGTATSQPTGHQDAVAFLVGEYTIEYQVDITKWQDCKFAPGIRTGTVTAGACWRTAQGGNTCQFGLEHCVFGGAQYGIDWQQASQSLTVDNCTFANFGVLSTNIGPDAACLRIGGGQALVRGCACQGQTSGSPARFITTGGGVGTLLVEGCGIFIDLPTDNGIIMYSGQTTLIGNGFAAGYGFNGNTNIPRIYVGDPMFQYSSGLSSVVSINNTYAFVSTGGYAPIYMQGNPVTGPSSDAFARGVMMQVYSMGDQGLTTSGQAQLAPWFGAIPSAGGRLTSSWSPSVPANGSTTTSPISTTVSPFYVPCNMGDVVSVSFSIGLPAGVILSASVSAANTVIATLVNMSGSAWNPGAGTLSFFVTRNP